jgi:hypothetical protein
VEAAGGHVECVDKGIDEADGMVLGNVVVERSGNKLTSWRFAP